MFYTYFIHFNVMVSTGLQSYKDLKLFLYQSISLYSILPLICRIYMTSINRDAFVKCRLYVKSIFRQHLLVALLILLISIC